MRVCLLVAYNTQNTDSYRKKQPLYSFGARFDRPKDKTVKPGPGSYNPQKARGAPKFSMGVRHSQFVLPVLTAADLHLYWPSHWLTGKMTHSSPTKCVASDWGPGVPHSLLQTPLLYQALRSFHRSQAQTSSKWQVTGRSAKLQLDNFELFLQNNDEDQSWSVSRSSSDSLKVTLPRPVSPESWAAKTELFVFSLHESLLNVVCSVNMFRESACPCH